jgi:hypothetical protein
LFAALLCSLPALGVFGVPCEGNILSAIEDYPFDSKLSIIEFDTSVTYVEGAAGE